MSIWTDTSSAALQAQLENTLFVFHFFAGWVFIHVLGTLRSVEWLIGRGRVACRWSLFNAAGSRILPLVSIASSIAWLDYQELGQRNQTALFVLAQTTQIISQIFSLMIITLGVASIWNNRQITYLVETAFLGIAGISFASLASEASDSVAPLSHTLFALVLARMIFCGFLLVLAFWGILNSRRQNIKLAPQPMASRVMSLYNTMRRDMFQCYFVAFIAQLPAVVAFALHVDHSGLLRLLTEFVSFASLTVMGSLVFKHMTSSKQCPVTQYCIVVGLVMHLAGLGQIVHRRWSHIHPHDAQARAVSGCPHLAGQKQLPTVEKSSTALTVLAEAGMISLDAKRDSIASGSASTTLEFASSSSSTHGVSYLYST